MGRRHSRLNLKTTRVSLDTCNCIINYEWDADVPDSERVHRYISHDRICDAHKQVKGNDENRYKVALGDNIRKNKALQLALDNIPSLVQTRIAKSSLNSKQQEIKVNNELNPSVNYEFSFTGQGENRILHIAFNGISLTQQQKNSLKSIMQNQFKDKVVVS